MATDNSIREDALNGTEPDEAPTRAALGPVAAVPVGNRRRIRRVAGPDAWPRRRFARVLVTEGVVEAVIGREGHTQQERVPQHYVLTHHDEAARSVHAADLREHCRKVDLVGLGERPVDLDQFLTCTP